MDRGLGIAQEIHGVMVAAAAQEREEIAAPIRDAKAQNIAVEFHDALHVGALIGDVAEFQWHNAGEIVVLRRKAEIGKDFKHRAFGIGEGDRFA